MRVLPTSDSCKLEGARRPAAARVAPRSSHAASHPGLPTALALARLAARRFLTQQARTQRRAHACLAPAAAALRPSVGHAGGRGAPRTRPNGVARWACPLGSLPPGSVARHAARRFAARAADGGQAGDGADVGELVGLFERAAAHERVNGYSNVAGRQFPNFGAFLLHALERLGAAGGATRADASAWAQARTEAQRYAALRVPERSVLVVRCCQGRARGDATLTRRPHAGSVRAALRRRARHACAA